MHEMAVQRIVRIAARHQALHRRAMGGDPRLRASRSTPTCDAGDVRLTMGGEPTFVSIDDRDADEWNTAALGPTKRARAADLLCRLKQRYGAERLRAFRPGQVVSRRAAAALGAGLLLARRRRAGLDRRQRCSPTSSIRDGYSAADAERFIAALAAQLGVTAEHVQPGYEDVWYYLWRERQLPVNVDPFDARLDDELERDRLRRVFTQGLDAVVGYALPLRRVGDGTDAGRRAAGSCAASACICARRLADGTSAAARLAAVGRAGRLAVRARARSDRASRAALRPARRRTRLRDPDGRSRRRPVQSCHRRTVTPEHAPSRRPTGRQRSRVVRRPR